MEIIFSPIKDVIEDIRNGRPVVIVDDENRENEGDIVAAAEKTTPEIINFMATCGRGLICVPLDSKRAEELNLSTPAILSDPFHTAFTESLDYKLGTTTGISAYDRSRTVTALGSGVAERGEFFSPGHVFPLIARPGGVLRRAGGGRNLGQDLALSAADAAAEAGYAERNVCADFCADSDERRR